MFKLKVITLMVAGSLSLSACASDQQWGMNKQTVGTTAGAVIGGVLASNVGKGSGQLWATGAGALLGAFVGSSIGQSLDRADRMYHQQATEKAYTAPIGDTIAWKNPESGHSGSVTAVNEGPEKSTGNYCRKYKQTIVVDGQAETAYGTACKQHDGTWALKNG